MMKRALGYMSTALPESLQLEDGAPLERQGRLVDSPVASSKMRRHGSKLISVLRSFTNSSKYNTFLMETFHQLHSLMFF
jgi:hypothetical protein